MAPGAGSQGFSALVLPAITLAAPGTGRLALIVRASMLHELDAFLMWSSTPPGLPGPLMALLILAFIGSNARTLVVVPAREGWLVYARVARGTVLTLRGIGFVEAAEIVDCRPRRVMGRHILPNLAGPTITLAILELARVMLTDSLMRTARRTR